MRGVMGTRSGEKMPAAYRNPAPLSDSSDSDSDTAQASPTASFVDKHSEKPATSPSLPSGLASSAGDSQSNGLVASSSSSSSSAQPRPLAHRASPPRHIHTPTSPMAISTEQDDDQQVSSKVLQNSALASPPTPAPSPSPTSNEAPDWSTAAEHEEWQARHLRLLFGQMNNPEKLRLLAELLNMCNSSQLAFVHGFVSPRLKKDPFTTLPNELCLRILTYVDEPKTLVRASQVSKRWYQLVNDDMAWKALCEKHAFRDAQIGPHVSESLRDYVMDATLDDGTSGCSSVSELFSHGETGKQAQESQGEHVEGPTSASSTRDDTPSGSMEIMGDSQDALGASWTTRKTKRRPKALTYRSHFKQRYQIETAWRSGGKMEQHQLTPDQGVVTSLHLTEDHIFVALDNAKIHVFDPEGIHQTTLKGHIMGVWAMAPCGSTHLVSGGCDRDVRMWDVRTGQSKLTMRGHTSTVRCLKLADSKTAISGSRDTTLRIWDLERGHCKHVLVGHGSSVRCLDIHGDLVVSGSYDTTAKIWSISEGKCLRTLSGHFSQIYAVAFDGKRIATGSLDTSVRIWDPTDGRCISVLQGHTSLVGQLQMREDVLVTGGSDGSVRVWSLTEFEPIHRLAAHDNSVTSLQFDDARIVSGGSDGRVKVWDLKNGTLVRELGAPATAVWRVVFEQEKAVVLAQRQTRTVMEVWSFSPPLSPSETPALYSSPSASTDGNLAKSTASLGETSAMTRTTRESRNLPQNMTSNTAVGEDISLDLETSAVARGRHREAAAAAAQAADRAGSPASIRDNTMMDYVATDANETGALSAAVEALEEAAFAQDSNVDETSHFSTNPDQVPSRRPSTRTSSARAALGSSSSSSSVSSSDSSPNQRVVVPAKPRRSAKAIKRVNGTVTQQQAAQHQQQQQQSVAGPSSSSTRSKSFAHSSEDEDGDIDMDE